MNKKDIERVADAGDKRKYVCGICGGFAEKEFCPCCGSEQADEIYPVEKEGK